MKNVIIAVVMMVSLATLAQDKKMKREEFTAEQRVELQVKKMTLDLDLNDRQQKDIKKLLTDQSKKHEEVKAQREAMQNSDKKPTADERFAMKSKMLDNRIAFKSEMKKILSDKQMEKWEALKKERMEKMQHQKAMRHHKKH